MTDKVQKIRKEIERLKSQLLRGACSSQIAIETMCKEEAYNEVLAILDTMQEEPVNRTHSDVESAMQEVEEKSSVFTEAHKGKDADTILAQMRGEEPVSKDYRERYKRIAQSEEFRKNYDGMSIGDIVPVEEQEPANEDLEKIVEEIAEPTILNAYGTKELARRLRNTICGISISEDLGEYINELSKQFPEVSFAKLSRIAVRVAKWQKENLWKPADGDDLPEIDREVIALLDNGKVVFSHRPPKFWDGKNIITGNVTRYYPKTYDKGEWNIPNIIYWLDVELPKEIEL